MSQLADEEKYRSEQVLKNQAWAPTGDAPTLKTQQHVELVSGAHLHLLEMALHPLAVFLEDFCRVVDSPFRPRNGSFYEPPCRFQEGAASRLHAVYAG